MSGRMLLFAVVLLCTFSAFVVAQDQQPRVEVQKLTDHIHQIVCYTSSPGNVLVSVGDDGVLVVDPAYRQTASLLHDEILKFNRGEAKFLIYSHDHSDHLGGPALFRKETVFVSQKQLRDRLRTGPNLLLDMPPEALPTVTFDHDMSLHFNGEEIKLIHFPLGHSTTDIAIYFTKSKVMYIGGLMYTGHFPYVGLRQGCRVSQLADNLQKVIDLAGNDDVTFVTAHGANCKIDDVKKYREMILETTALVQKELDAGRSPDQIDGEKLLKDWQSWSWLYVNTDGWAKTIADSIQNTAVPSRKPPISDLLYYEVQKGDGASAVKLYREMKRTKPDDYDFSEPVLNYFGYYLLQQKNRPKDAIEIFRLNVELFPKAFNTYDSLAEAYMAAGEKKLAIENYKKSLELNPKNDNAVQFLKQLEK